MTSYNPVLVWKPVQDSTKSSSLEDKGHGQITVKTYISYLFMGSSYVLAALIVALFLVSQVRLSDVQQCG